jgi:hypothetical protein
VATSFCKGKRAESGRHGSELGTRALEVPVNDLVDTRHPALLGIAYRINVSRQTIAERNGLR